MKRIVLLLALVMGLSFVAVAQNNNNGQSLTQKALQAAKSCVQNAKEPGFVMTTSTEVISSCFAGGFITEVTIYKVPKGAVNTVAVSEVVAVVSFGCSDEVTGVVCGF